MGSVLVALLMVEALLRLFDPLGIEYIGEHERLLRMMPRHPSYAYLMPPNMSEVFQRVRIETNSEGLRGPEFSLQKEPGVKRVLLVGDSVVLSWGVEQRQTLAAQLEKLLDASGEEFEVISVAALSWNTRNQAEFLKERAALYNPDALVLIVVSNDIIAKPVGKTFVPTEKLRPTTPEYGALNQIRLWVARHSFLFALIHRQILIGELQERFLEGYRPGSAEREDAADAFDEIARLADELQVPLIGYLYFLHAERTSPGGQAYEEFYGTLFRKHGLDYDIFPQEIYDTEHRNSRIDPHQNAQGLQIMARHIQARLQDSGVVSSP